MNIEIKNLNNFIEKFTSIVFQSYKYLGIYF